MTHPPRATLKMILACAWVLGIFALYMLQFKSIIQSVTGWVIS